MEAASVPSGGDATGLPVRGDFVVVGGGVVGLTIALELRRRHSDCSVVVLEKEGCVGAHASGRNSGVLHAGFYYAADSLKAALAREGNRRLTAWCEEHGVPLRRTGKLVVARDQSEHAGLDRLLERAAQSGVELEDVDEAQARAIEPRAKTFGRALWSPTTSSVDPRQVMAALATQAQRAGVRIVTRTSWLAVQPGAVLSSRGRIAAGYVVNAAGLHADRVARAYGFGDRYRMLPFKGLYLHGNAAAPPLRTCVYPVPRLDMPFLGVHFTLAIDGGVKIGPTALPALWLESYRRCGSEQWLHRFDAGQLATIVVQGARLLWKSPALRRHARAELSKVSRRVLVRHAAELVRGVHLDAFDRWGRAGIRAQLVDRGRAELVMDFLLQGDDRSMHVLNAVSPAFTCALPFAERVVDAIAAGGVS